MESGVRSVGASPYNPKYRKPERDEKEREWRR
jgi:hypothetical protein